MKFGIHNAYASVNWGDVDYRDVVVRVADLGYDFIEVNPSKLHLMSAQDRREIRALAEDKGLDIICSFGLPYKYDPSNVDETIRKGAVAYIKEILHVVHEMGSHLYAGCNYSYWPFRYTSPMPDRRQLLDQSVKSIKEVIKLAEDLDIDYSMEPLNRYEGYLLNTGKEGVAFCEEVGSPRIKLNMDIFHMNIEEDSINEALITTKDVLTDLHFGENNRTFPGMGGFDWRGIIKTLKSFNYDQYICLEPFIVPGGEVSECIFLWRNIIEDVSQENMDRLAKESLAYLKSLVALN